MLLSSRALRRRAKTYLRRNQLDLYIPVLPGFETVAADELRDFGYSPTIARGGISFRGDLTSVYEANLAHRTGSRVLLRVDRFLAQNYPMLYHHTLRTPWEVLLGNCPSLSVRATFRSSRLRNRTHIEEVVRDAIQSRLERNGMSIAHKSTPAVVVHARIFRDRCTLSQDTTGEHLHRRGYRPEPAEAPLRETSAAAALLAASSTDYDVVVDPFCGSGTIPIEADLLARNVAPNLNRSFSIECSPLHSRGGLAETRRRVEGRRRNPTKKRVLGFDLSSEAISLAERCSERAMTSTVSFHVADAMDVNYASLCLGSDNGLIATNLPYGVRVGTPETATELVLTFAERLRESAKGWHFLIITPAKSALASALPVTSTIPFQNGGIRVYALLGRIPS